MSSTRREDAAVVQGHADLGAKLRVGIVGAGGDTYPVVLPSECSRESSMGFVSENQVRTRLPAGAKGIRTAGHP